MKKMVPALAATAVLALGLSACGSSSGGSTNSASVDTSSLPALVAAAKKESGTITVYSQMPAASQTALDKAFTEKYGIKVNAVSLQGNTIYTRFESEARAGGSPADVLIDTDPTANFAEEQEGLLIGWSKSGVPPLLPDFPSQYVLKDYDVPLLQTIDTGFIYNTDKISKSELPTTWAELAAPKYKGLLCTTLPDTSIDNAVFFQVMLDKSGAGTLKGIGANIGTTYSDVLAENAGVGAGECGLGFNSASFFVQPMVANGQHVAFAPMPSTYYPPTVAAVNAKAQDPNSARLYLEYIESEEGNVVLNAPGSGSLGPYSPASDFPSPYAETPPSQYTTASANINTLMGDLGQNG